MTFIAPTAKFSKSKSDGSRRGHPFCLGATSETTRAPCWTGVASFCLRWIWAILPLMASPNGIATLPRIKPGRRGALAQALELQQILLQTAADPQITPHALAAIARAWCAVNDTIRIIRGRPLPGQLRPESDPVVLAKQLRNLVRRHRSRSPIEIPAVLGGIECGYGCQPIDGSIIDPSGGEPPEED